MSQTPFHWPVRIYYEDTDAGGIVYNANYLKFMERARTEWLRHLGVEQDNLLEQGIAFVVRRVEMDLRRAARFNDALTVTVTVKMLKRASIVFEQEILDHAGLCLVKGEIVIACVDITKMKPFAIPESLMGVLSGAR
ncbi:tol-pal system-associated acyl-CoA thioesterase [Oceanimonas baumannii]|uniref:Acyl-CoA thioester hydrolase n=1 Tax=Oceanimonas baumannii TaxID=129578 RepID=A0A235CPU5_9GAMM|nr:tol-pal system-associated acyl-CoA thioesterase [Oceanimonas baumannii]MCC4266162.1 tol-pal system-associated acyl-CoA thioesterase [Oceanimonas baumannii]OYD26017.1 tol-pal system-associated acyl-CoA thioesterase [Oceanimonas baumannii]TDW62342.1 acyl-CoA thioester hydrolase [Oceanimonas baumannii]